jgi:intracellular sulfur oxidation DsrE/DsrF family protein
MEVKFNFIRRDAMQKLSNNKTKYIALIIAFVFVAAITLIASHAKHKKSYSTLIKLEQKFGGKNKETVLTDLKIAKSYATSGQLTPPKFIPVGKYKNLKSPLKIVFGISGGDKNNLKETLGNIFYIIQYAKKNNLKYKFAVVIYGKMAAYLHPVPKGGYLIKNRINTDMLYAVKHGVKFYACYNALMINHLIHKEIPYFVTPVPMGLLKVYELRQKGYLYFTNP